MPSPEMQAAADKMISATKEYVKRELDKRIGPLEARIAQQEQQLASQATEIATLSKRIGNTR